MFILPKKNISFKKIRHNDSKYYVTEGYGGKSLENWPVTCFYGKFIEGDRVEAVNNYIEWYEFQLDKYASKPGKEGGMYQGSLYRLIEKRTGKNFSNSTKDEKRRCIKERVMQRFALLEDIQKNGYCLEKTEQIYSVKKNGFVYLKGGHHRAAALLALGEESVPEILVFPTQLVYNTFDKLRKLKRYANF